MLQPATRASVITKALDELQRMEPRRGHTTALDERRLLRALTSMDDSPESEVAKAAIKAQWDRNFAEFDATATALLDMYGLSEPGTLYVNFALICHNALNPALGSQLNRKAFQFNQNNPEFIQHVTRNAWHAGDIDLYAQAVERLKKLGAESYVELRGPHEESTRLLADCGVTHDEFQSYTQLICELVRGFLSQRPDIRLGYGIELEDFDDGHQELVLQFDLALDDDTLDAIDAAVLELLSDTSRVRPALNKCVGVLVRDYPQSLDAEAC